jgi:hypothetical protein
MTWKRKSPIPQEKLVLPIRFCLTDRLGFFTKRTTRLSHCSHGSLDLLLPYTPRNLPDGEYATGQYYAYFAVCCQDVVLAIVTDNAGAYRFPKPQK